MWGTGPSQDCGRIGVWASGAWLESRKRAGDRWRSGEPSHKHSLGAPPQSRESLQERPSFWVWAILLDRGLGAQEVVRLCERGGGALGR